MDKEQRAALVGEIAVILQQVKYLGLGESLEPIANSIIDRLLAYRDDATVGDPDVVELARSIQLALNQYTREASTIGDDGRRYVTNYTSEGELAAIRSAIAAMPSGANYNWLDEALDSVNPRWMPGTARIKEMYQGQGREWHVVIAKPGGTGSGFVDEDTWEGTGTTRREAILDAVQKRKGG